MLAVDQGDGDVLALTAPFEDTQTVRRLDGRTGAVEWTTGVSGDLTSIEVDPTDGRVVLAGAYNGPLRMVVLDRGGQLARDVDTDIAMRWVADLEVDPESWLACTLGSQGRRGDVQAWVTSCWDRAGGLVFSRTWTSSDVRTVPDDLVIDPVRGRVYVLAGPGVIQQPVTLFSFDTRGRTRFVGAGATPAASTRARWR